jgi:hypothetical protein
MIASAGYDLAHIYSPLRVAGEVSISALANVRVPLDSASNHLDDPLLTLVPASSHGCSQYKAGCQNGSPGEPKIQYP